MPATGVIPEPVFDGSRVVGGADADWIAGGRLVDVKATIHPHKLDLGTIHQLVGYVLLDYSDTHHITDVGLYLARCGRSARRKGRRQARVVLGCTQLGHRYPPGSPLTWPQPPPKWRSGDRTPTVTVNVMTSRRLYLALLTQRLTARA